MEHNITDQEIGADLKVFADGIRSDIDQITGKLEKAKTNAFVASEIVEGVEKVEMLRKIDLLQRTIDTLKSQSRFRETIIEIGHLISSSENSRYIGGSNRINEIMEQYLKQK